MKNGAELECFLSYKSIESSWVYHVDKYLEENELMFNEERAYIAYGDDYVTPEIIASQLGWQRLKEKNFSNNGFRAITLKTEGVIYDVKSSIYVHLEFDINVITFSAYEGFLWNHDTAKHSPDIKRLKVYASLCRNFAKNFIPEYSTMTNLGIHSCDMARESISEERKKMYSYSENFLSDEEVNDLYDWYTKEYAPLRRV